MSASLDDVLELAAQTLEEYPDRWTQGALIRDRTGREISVWRECDPHSACALGMVVLAAESMGEVGTVVSNVVDDAYVARYGDDMAAWNDYEARDAAEVAARLRSLKDNDPDE